jgi:D-arabinose 1-dehydrogenase-like Zn-dependent alcohol dehydrogenase
MRRYARKMGFRTVALSSSGSKRDFAHQLGANDYVDGSKEDTVEALQKMGGAALIVVTAPNPEIIGKLVAGCAPRGKVLVLARKCVHSLAGSTLLTRMDSGRRHYGQYYSDDHEGYLCPWLAKRPRPR